MNVSARVVLEAGSTMALVSGYATLSRNGTGCVNVTLSRDLGPQPLCSHEVEGMHA